MPMKLKRLMGLGFSLACICTALIGNAQAETLQSTNYKFDESIVGAGGVIDSSSASYQAGVSVGDTAIGPSSSANFQTQAGSQTSNDPTLSFAVNNGNVNFGDFSTASAATATSTFQVSDYTSYGYAVQLIGNPPALGNHTIAAMSTTGASQSGIEQFGINLVANTSPVSLGANPNQGQFGTGIASTNYNTSNNYRYVSGETVAQAPKSSGLTIFTISYIINVTSLTPGGQYTGSQVLVCTGTY
ncbi:MAG: hypothetical protein NVS1B10_07150 [Candidatus Saccharimonadales bacterium]